MPEPAAQLIRILGLKKHPEGGWYRETYRSAETISVKHLPGRYTSFRNMATAIYYLLESGDFSAFHRIKSDEIWNYYSGSPIRITLLKEGKIAELILGPDLLNGELFQVVIPKNTWFAAEPVNDEGYSLAGCIVAPGFDFEDFEMADRTVMLKLYPGLSKTILRLTRE
ncbi:MAG: hypothetical protein Kow00127_03350 [Bacteroidales bacterium]